MGKIKRQIIEIKISDLDKLEDRFFEQIQMNRERVFKKFSKQLEETKQAVITGTSIRGLIEFYKIEKIEEENVILENGYVMSSNMLAELLKTAEELVVCAVTVLGYDELEEQEKDMFKNLFIDGWGTALASCSHASIVKKLRNDMLKEGRYVTQAWCPGQHKIDITLQRDIFALIHPEEIGISLSEGCMMEPKKSVTSFVGIGWDENMAQVRPCDFCNLRETCPSAYS